MGSTVARKTRTSAPFLSPLALLVLGVALFIGAFQGSSPSSADSHIVADAEDVSITPGDVLVTDTYIDEAEADAVQDAVTLELDPAAEQRKMAAIKFDFEDAADLHLDGYPDDIAVENATLRLKLETAPGEETDIRVHRRNAAFDESDATWENDRGDWTNGTSSTYTIASDAEAGDVVELDVTSQVDGWLGSHTNHGLSLQVDSGTAALAFYSSEAAEDDRPELDISYGTSVASLQASGSYNSDIDGEYEDTFVEKANSDAANGDQPFIEIDYRSADEVSDALLRFDLDGEASKLERARVLKAELTLTVEDDVPGERPVRARRVCGPDTLGIDGAIMDATWDNIPHEDLERRDDIVDGQYNDPATTLTFNVTEFVQSWAAGESNMGVWLYQDDPSISQSPLSFHSFNASDPDDRPHLEITYVEDRGDDNPTPTPDCTEATPTPEPTETVETPEPHPTEEPDPDDTPTPDPDDTPTPQPTPGDEDDGEPEESDELTLSGPALETPVSRSRLAFIADTGDIDASDVSFVIERDHDDPFWDAGAGEWTDEEIQNPAVEDSGEWQLPVEGVAMRAFVNTTVEVTVHATDGDDHFVSDDVFTLIIR